MNDLSVALFIDRLLCEYCSRPTEACPCTRQPLDIRRLQAAVNVEHRAAVRRAESNQRTRRAA